MTTSQIPRTYWEDFPVGHRVQHGGMPVSREAVLTMEGWGMFRRRPGA